jgi:hypothetical protein
MDRIAELEAALADAERRRQEAEDLFWSCQRKCERNMARTAAILRELEELREAR